jgi:hypothetical protein
MYLKTQATKTVCVGMLSAQDQFIPTPGSTPRLWHAVLLSALQGGGAEDCQRPPNRGGGQQQHSFAGVWGAHCVELVGTLLWQTCVL